MNSIISFGNILLLLACTLNVSEAQVIGRWKTIGDQDKKDKAIIEIYERDGRLFGKVEKLLPDAKITTCVRCEGSLRDKPIAGMVILHDLKKTSSGGVDGRILDPSSGKTYKCMVDLESPDKLKLRGYIGVPSLGRTQYWYRVKA